MYRNTLFPNLLVLPTRCVQTEEVFRQRTAYRLTKWLVLSEWLVLYVPASHSGTLAVLRIQLQPAHFGIIST